MCPSIETNEALIKSKNETLSRFSFSVILKSQGSQPGALPFVLLIKSFLYDCDSVLSTGCVLALFQAPGIQRCTA